MSKNTNELNLKHLVKLFFIAFAIFAAMCLFTLFGFSFVKNGEPQNQKKETSENTTEVWENENIDFYETENKDFTPTSSAEITEENAVIIPCSISSVTERNNYQPTPLTGL